MKTHLNLTLIFVLFLTAVTHAGTIIDNVSIEGVPAAQEKSASPETGTATAKAYTMSWQLNMPGKVTVLIVDLQGNILTTFKDKEELSAGAHTVSWDGRDEAGNQCPDGLYFPVIRIQTKTRGVETYNPTAAPWGEEIIPDSISYDPAARVVSYSLSKATLCRIRVGEKDGGPLYKTVADWKYRVPGTYEEPWDGMDTNSLVKVYAKDKFFLVFDGLSAPQNTIVIAGSPVRALQNAYKAYPIYPPHGKNIVYYSFFPQGFQPDLTVTAQFPGGIKKSKKGYRLAGPTSINVDLDPGAAGINPEEKIELYLFLDGKLLNEGPVPKLPSSLRMETTEISNGSHVVTVGLRTSFDRAGTTSLPVFIEN